MRVVSENVCLSSPIPAAIVYLDFIFGEGTCKTRKLTSIQKYYHQLTPKAPSCPLFKLGFKKKTKNKNLPIKKLPISETEGSLVTWGHCSAVNCISAM